MSKPLDDIRLEHISRTIGSDLHVHIDDLKSNVVNAYNNGMLDMCEMILKMIVNNQCDADNIKGWCEAYIKVCAVQNNIHEMGENPWQE